MYKQFARMLSNGSVFFGVFLSLAYMLAKAPLLLWGQMELNPPKLLLALFLLSSLLLSSVVLLVRFRRVYGCCFLVLFNILFLLNLIANDFSSFGFFKYASLSILISLTAIVYCITPKRHSLAEVLLVFAGLLAIYGCLAVLWEVIKGQQFALRESIGLNGPIVFGQLMVISSALFLLYGNRRFIIASVPAALSLLSFSKGPILSGLFILFLKRKKIFVLLLLLLPVFALMSPIDLFDNRLFYFIESLYEAVASSDTSLLFSGSNYGSIGSRLDQYVLAVNLLSEHPLGIGLGQWSLVSEHEYPHNYLVEILVEQGLVFGLGSLLAVLFFFTKITDRNLKYVVVMFFLFSMFSGSIVDNRGIYLVILLGLLYRQSEY
ncbi:O-antigen ligase family protein [Pseudomonas sp. GZD-222]|uniref:O-antigen ligase family protein n=1 Tax=Pseudomonas sp. GZD-222 TaxID=3404805 RepID=UPI003BB6927F